MFRTLNFLCFNKKFFVQKKINYTRLDNYSCDTHDIM